MTTRAPAASERVPFCFHDDEAIHQRLKHLAESEDRTISYFLRQAVRLFLESHPATQTEA